MRPESTATPLPRPDGSATSIRQRAVVTAVLLVAVGTGLGLGSGHSWREATATAALGALMGLVTWTTYHLVCGQPNGLILVSGYVAPLVMGKVLPGWGLAVFLLIFAAAFGYLIGLWSRLRDGV